MKISSKMEKCRLSPMRVFNPNALAAKKRGIKIYHLNIGQPDILTPPAFFDALSNINSPVIEYAPSGGVPEYLESVVNYFKGIGVELDTSNVLATTGGSEALQMTMASILDDGDEIVIPEPFYPNYHTSVTLAGASIRPIHTTPAEGYRYAVRERVEACINERTRAIMITNPGNPTGTILSPDELKLMLDIAKEHELFIICDEVYREFLYGGEQLQSALAYKGYEENVIVIDSVSKRFSACGARIGAVISRNKEFMAQAMKWCQCRLAAPYVDQIACAALYNTNVGDEYFGPTRDEYRARRDTVTAGLDAIPGVVYAQPKGAFYCMAALPVDDAAKFQYWLLDEFNDNGETVMFACGEPFYGTPGAGKNEIRIAYVLNTGDLKRAMELLKIAIEKYNSLNK